MQLNRKNYEAYLLDMAEGKLTREEEELLMQFLEANPGLEADTDLAGITLEAPSVEFIRKEDLKKGGLAAKVTHGNFEQFCIAAAEGDLDEDSLDALKGFLEGNPEYIKDAKLFELLKLKPDKSVIFKYKKSILKHALPHKKGAGHIRRLLYRSVSIAATIAILISAGFFAGHLFRNDTPALAPERRMASWPAERVRSEEIIFENVRIIPADHEILLTQQIVESELSEAPSEEIHFSRELFTIAPLTVRSQGPVLLKHSQPAENHPDLAGLYTPSFVFDGREAAATGSLVSRLTNLVARVADDEVKERLTFWDVADAGVKGINSITGTEMRLERELDPDGQVVSLAFNSRLVAFERTVSVNHD
ncbi:MAG: hypothetical protein EA408_08400 [Marinilabiliales bacterium]|nr:MAG: hypothetical protein EA408_08400 [Marinilabiliales bacterium]